MHQAPFVIFFQGRSGSTLLASLLASHPDVFCRNEEFSLTNAQGFDARGERNRLLAPFFGEPEIINPTASQCIDRLEKIFSRSFDAVGFKFKIPGQTDTYPEILEALLARPESLRVIHLFRINQMKRGVSRQHLVQQLQSPSKAEMRGGNVRSEGESQKFVVDLGLLKSFFKRLERQQSRFNDILVQFPRRFQVSYEELASEPRKAMQRVLKFLEVDPEFVLNTRYRKLTPDSLREIVENYSDLVTAFKGTEYEKFLDQEDSRAD